MKYLIPILLLAFSESAFSQAEYLEKKDDFSNGVIKAVIVKSEEVETYRFGSPEGWIQLICFPENRLQVHLHSLNAIYPDDVDTEGHNRMFASATFKFDTENEADTSDWEMNFMKYDRAFYKGDVLKFAHNLAKANELNFRFNKRSDIYKFKLKGTSKLVPKVLKHCNYNFKNYAEFRENLKKLNTEELLLSVDKVISESEDLLEYHSLIRDKITSNWIQPANAGDKPLCVVRVIQDSGGSILGVAFVSCPGTREYRISVEAAILKSDPLPLPSDPSLFARTLTFNFKPTD